MDFSNKYKERQKASIMAAAKTLELFLQMVFYTKLALEMHCLNN